MLFWDTSASNASDSWLPTYCRIHEHRFENCRRCRTFSYVLGSIAGLKARWQFGICTPSLTLNPPPPPAFVITMSSTQSNNNNGGQYQYNLYDTPRTARRIAMACQFCRIRKLRCDGMRPQCSNCSRRGFACNYVPVGAQGAK
ncbi:hypothetical protein C8R45DRAFT_523249 [Mycena sanguinolenta]|nr:hypothetical protein C8R45DRAFT_523249 [Mycena sanguinolenta]